jgi:hypothetical protein
LITETNEILTQIEPLDYLSKLDYWLRRIVISHKYSKLGETNL